MGRPAPAIPPTQPYRDDVDAVSMYTTPDDYQYDDVPELPPPYSDSEPASQLSNHEATVQPGETERPQVWSHVSAITRGDTILVMDARLTNPDNLYPWIQSITMCPPNQTIRIHGWHNSTVHRNNKKETERVVDFDINISLKAYLPGAGAQQDGWLPELAANHDKVHRGSWRKTIAPGHKDDIERFEYERDLSQWCEDFCASDARLKIFRVTQDVTGLDTDYLRKNIDALIRSTNYRGHTQITFPIEGRFVDVYNPHTINKWRINWVRWLFYISMLWIITWPILFFATKRWTVYSVKWRFSWVEQTGKRYAVLTEPAWYNKHAKFIQRLAVDRFQGDATNLPLDDQRGLEQVMPTTGNADIDSAMSLIRTGVGAWNTIQRGVGRDVDGWGADC